MVIDIKDYSGYILYDTQVAEVNKIKAKKIIKWQPQIPLYTGFEKLINYFKKI